MTIEVSRGSQFQNDPHVTLTKEYSDGLLSDLYVYCYSEDDDTLYVDIQGWDPKTSSWKNIYYASNTTSGTKVDKDVVNIGYT